MKETDGELISALLDGEIAPQAHRATVKKLIQAGPEATDTFGRYRLIGDLMRDESAHIIAVADRVSAALHDEPTIVAPQQTSRTSRWLRPVAGVALAASVAAVAIVVAPRLLDSGPLAPSDSSVATSAPVTPLPTLVAGLPASPASALAAADAGGEATTDQRRGWQTMDSQLADRLDRLVIEHHEFGGRTGINGPVPHIGFVSYDAR